MWWNKQVDYKLFFVVFWLMIFWMVMISSVSVYSSFRVTSTLVASWTIKEAYNYFYVVRHITYVLLSLVLLLFFVKIPYTFFEKNAKKIFSFNVLLLVFVLLFWSTFGWSRRWLILPWIPFSIQPSEFLVFSVVIFFASYFKKYLSKLSDFKEWYLPFLWLIWIVCLLLALQPKFWAILIVWTVAFSMYLISWARLKHIFSTLAIAMLWAVMIYSMWKYDEKDITTRNSLSYITERVDIFLANKKDLIASRKINYQLEQWFIAIWSWWFAWLWFWNSIQKFWYLPEAQWDFIYAIIIEELWFVWGLLLLWIYLYIGYRWFYISYYSPDLFSKLASFWVSTWILIQAFINMWVSLSILPLTWITLPFLSYWWSSILALTMWIWLLLNISRYIEPSKKYSRKNHFSNSNIHLNLHD